MEGIHMANKELKVTVNIRPLILVCGSIDDKPVYQAYSMEEEKWSSYTITEVKELFSNFLKGN